MVSFLLFYPHKGRDEQRKWAFNYFSASSNIFLKVKYNFSCILK